MTILTELEAIAIESLTTGVRGPISVAVERLENSLLTMTPAQQIVVEHRLLREPKTTLEKVGSLIGVTRERIRQLQVKLQPRIAQAMGPEMRLVASVLREDLDPIVEEQVLDRRMDKHARHRHRIGRKALSDRPSSPKWVIPASKAPTWTNRHSR